MGCMVAIVTLGSLVNSKGKSHARYPKSLQTTRRLGQRVPGRACLDLYCRVAKYRYKGFLFRYPRASLSPELLPISGRHGACPTTAEMYQYPPLNHRQWCSSTTCPPGQGPGPARPSVYVLHRSGLVMNSMLASTCSDQHRSRVHPKKPWTWGVLMLPRRWDGSC